MVHHTGSAAVVGPEMATASSQHRIELFPFLPTSLVGDEIYLAAPDVDFVLEAHEVAPSEISSDFCAVIDMAAAESFVVGEQAVDKVDKHLVALATDRDSYYGRHVHNAILSSCQKQTVVINIWSK